MSLTKILIAYSSKPPILEYLERSFTKMGMEVGKFYSDNNHWFDRYCIRHINKQAHNLRILPKEKNFFKDYPLAHLNYRSSRLLKAVEAFSPDLVLMVRGIRFRKETLEEIRKRAVLFGWWIEREERMEEAFNEISIVDHYFFMNSSAVEEGARREYSNKVSLLLHAVDPYIFHPIDCGKLYDWCFVGGWSEKRQEYIEKAIEVSPSGIVYGPRWRKKNLLKRRISKVIEGSYLYGKDLTRLYSETKVVLNVTNWGFGEGEKRSGINMRILEVPACKAFLLTDGSRDIRNVVTPGKDLAVYEGINDFKDKLAHYINNDEERERIALSGFRHVTGHYTYDNVVRKIIKTYVRRERPLAQVGI